MRRPGIAAMGLLLAATAGLGAAAVPAHADESRLRGALSTADVATRTVLVPVPDGVVPRRLVGTVVVESGAGAEPRGTLEILVDGKVVESLPPRERTSLRTPVQRSDVSRDGFLEVGLRWNRGCAAPGLTASLQDLGLVHGGAESAPVSESDFLGPAVTRLDVVVPRSATDDVLEAALETVALLTEHYGDLVPVELSSADTVLPRVGAGQRVLRLEPGPSLSRGLEQRFGLWTLVLRGPGAALRNTVRDALASPLQRRTPGGTQTLADLAVPTALGGWGTSSTTVDLPQDLFGGVVDGLELRLVGSHSAVPSGTLARLDVRLDGLLLDSLDLGQRDATTLDHEVRIPAERLRAGSALEVLLTAVPDGGCAAIGRALPVELDLDPTLSRVTAGLGDSDVAGFQRLPASLDGELAVALRARDSDRVDAAADAARLVAALQRAAGLPLDVTLVTPEELVSGDQAGVLVGASATDALAVRAPVRLEAGGTAAVSEDDGAFAALQAVTHHDRDLVLLGGWSPEGDDVPALMRDLADRALDDGWGALAGGAVVQAESGTAVTVPPASPTPPPAGPGAGPNPYAPYLLGAAALLVLALILQAAVVIRRDRRLRQRAAISPGRPRQQP